MASSSKRKPQSPTALIRRLRVRVRELEKEAATNRALIRELEQRANEPVQLPNGGLRFPDGGQCGPLMLHVRPFC